MKEMAGILSLFNLVEDQETSTVPLGKLGVEFVKVTLMFRRPSTSLPARTMHDCCQTAEPVPTGSSATVCCYLIEGEVRAGEHWLQATCRATAGRGALKKSLDPPTDEGFQLVVFGNTSLDVSAEVDFAFNDVIQVGAFGRHNGFDLEKALIYGATANYLFNLALRGDTDLLEEFSQRHIESFLVHLLSHSNSCVAVHSNSIWLV